MQSFEEGLKFENLINVAAPLSPEVIEEKVKSKAAEIAEDFRHKSSGAIDNVFADLIAIAVFGLVLVVSKKEIVILKSFMDDMVGGMSDSTKAFVIILCLNIVLSLLLVFRTNTAHERFWEGRKLWTAMVNTVRNLARGIWVVSEENEPHDRAEKEAALRLVVAFAVATKLHLCREPMNPELAPLMPAFAYHKLQDADHPPLEIAFGIADYLQFQHGRQYVNTFQLAALQKLLDDMVDILGGCERILKTPLPLFYTITLKILLLTYFLVMPWGLVSGLTWWTGPILAFRRNWRRDRRTFRTRPQRFAFRLYLQHDAA